MSTDKAAVVLKRLFFNSLSEPYEPYLRPLQSSVTVSNEQVWNIEKTKASKLRLYRVAPLRMQQFKRGDQMYASSQVKSALKKSEKKAKIVTVIY